MNTLQTTILVIEYKIESQIHNKNMRIATVGNNNIYVCR